jgi:hypothetical protein
VAPTPNQQIYSKVLLVPGFYFLTQYIDFDFKFNKTQSYKEFKQLNAQRGYSSSKAINWGRANQSKRAY